jgi:hypothetical protein
MFNLLGKLFFFKHPLVKAARSGDSKMFIVRLCETPVFVYTSGNYDNGLPEGLSQDEVLKILEQEAERADKAESFELYTYSKAGIEYLPFFTSHKKAENYCRALVHETNRIYSLLSLEISGLQLMVLADDNLQLIMNDKSDDTYLFSDEDRAVIKSLKPEET